MTEYAFRLTGTVKPYVRMTRRGKWVDPQAQEYLASQDALGWQLKQQMQANEWEMIPRGIPLAAVIVIQPVRHDEDIDNLAKALLDAAQKIVFEDDRWVDAALVFRHNRGKHVVEMVVTEKWPKPSFSKLLDVLQISTRGL